MEMDWTQALTIIFTVFGMLLAFVIYLMSRIDSNQKETNAKFEQLLNRMDQKSDHLEQKMDSNQKELEQKMDSNQKENNAKFEVMNSRFNGLENRLNAMESEIKSVNQNLGQRIESTNQRIENTNQRIDSTNQRITDFKTDMNQRLSTIEGYLVPKKVFHFEESHHKDDHDEPKEN